MEKEILIWVALSLMLAALIAVTAFVVSLLTLRQLKKELAKEAGERKALEFKLGQLEEALGERPTLALGVSPAGDRQALLEEVDKRILAATKEHMTMAVMDRKLEGSRENWLFLVEQMIKKAIETLPRNGSPAFADPSLRRLGFLESSIGAMGRNVKAMNGVVRTLFQVLSNMNDRRGVGAELEKLRKAVQEADRLHSSIKVRLRELEGKLLPETPSESDAEAHVLKHFKDASWAVKAEQYSKYMTDHGDIRSQQLEEIERARRDVTEAEAALQEARNALHTFEADPANTSSLARIKALEALLGDLSRMEATLLQAEQDMLRSRQIVASSTPPPSSPPPTTSAPPGPLPPPPRPPS